MKIADLLKTLYKETGRPFTETDKKFDTYQKYLSNTVAFIKSNRKTREVAESFWNRTQDIKAIDNLDLSVLRRFLFIGWNTEILSRANDQREIEFLRINNQWKPIQSYYAVYSVGEALAYAINGQKVESHIGCLKKLNIFLANTVKIEPWSFAFMGNERQGFQPINFPPGTKAVSNLKQSEYEPIEMIMTCIRAEHRNLIEDFEPRKNNGKRSLKKDHDPGMTTILNFLYRLRIKSNYKDVEIFIHEAPEELTKGFSENLSKTIFYTIMLFEILIIRRYGLKKFLALGQEFLEKNPAEEGLALRMKFYKEKDL